MRPGQLKKGRFSDFLNKVETIVLVRLGGLPSTLPQVCPVDSSQKT